jgi:hypothetical protein
LCDLLHAWLASADRRLALTSRQGLLSLHDSRAGEQLWAALRPDAAGSATHSFRAMVLYGLASWQPEGFDHSGLRSLLHDTDPTVRAHAALVAGQVRARNLIEDLVALGDDTSEIPKFSSTVARMSTEALDRIQGKRPPWQSRLRPQ